MHGIHGMQGKHGEEYNVFIISSRTHVAVYRAAILGTGETGMQSCH